MPSRSSSSQRVTSALLLFAVVVFGLAVRGSSVGASLGVVVATACVAVALHLDRKGTRAVSSGTERPLEARLAAVVVVFGVLGGVGAVSAAIGPTTPLLDQLPGWIFAALGVIAYAVPRSRWRSATALIALAAWTLTLVVGLAHVSSAKGVGYDVLFLHARAADAIADGQNPYTDAVEVADGSPHAAPGQLISGYVYPPVTAISYAAGYWIGSDPRYTSLVAWLAVLGLVGLSAVRTARRSHLLAMLVLAALPGWPLVLRAAWTEPLSLLFMAVAFFWWRRPWVSGLGLGLGLASKQYFVVTAPLYLMIRETGWLRRLTIAFAVVALTLGAALALDFSTFWESAVSFHTSRPPRFDSINLVGLLYGFGIEWSPPSLLALVTGLGAAIYAGRIARSARQVALALALSLAGSFLVSSQAFANYWFLVFGLCALALVLDGSDKETVNTQPI